MSVNDPLTLLMSYRKARLYSEMLYPELAAIRALYVPGIEQKHAALGMLPPHSCRLMVIRTANRQRRAVRCNIYPGEAGALFDDKQSQRIVWVGGGGKRGS